MKNANNKKKTKLERGAKKRAKAVKYLDDNKKKIASNRLLVSDLFTFLSFGGGQDSTALLLLYIFLLPFKRDFAPGRLIVVMSDTGAEHDYTYENVEIMMDLCKKHDIPFFFLTEGDIYHTKAWPNAIVPQMREIDSEFVDTMIQLNTKSCTDKLKIQPIYKFIDSYLNSYFGYDFPIIADGEKGAGGTGKKAFNKFVKENGKVRVLIGFAYGEETRAMSSRMLEASDYKVKLSPTGKVKYNWKEGIFREFPLIDLKMDRQGCQDYIEGKGFVAPMPSNCWLCPYMSMAELLWLFRNDADKFYQWVAIEKNKMDKQDLNPVYKEKNITSENPKGLVDNNGVMNKKGATLLTMLEDAKAKYGDWSDDQLDNYKMNHGCDGNSNF